MTATLARALVAGELPATLHVAWQPMPFRPRYVTDHNGTPLLLVADDSSLANALSMRPGAQDVAVVLTVGDDELRVWISGWAAPVERDELPEALDRFAAARPLGELLDVGRGETLYTVDVAEVRLERSDSITIIDPGDYETAPPPTSSQNVS